MPYRKILSDLIAIDTHTARDSLDCVDYIRNYLAQHNVDSKIIYNPTKTRASLFATISNPQGAVVLNGHMDTVPVTLDAWDTNPFVLTERNGKFYGRGVCDMKGAIAVALSLVPYFIKNRQNIGFIFTHDEEDADNGIIETLADCDVMNYLHKTAGVIVMEPSRRQIISEHKNVADITVTVRGTPAHSSNPALGTDAIYYLTAAMNLFYEMLAEYRQEDDSYDIPYSTGLIPRVSGGNAVNVVPATATMTLSVRFMSDMARDAFINAYRTGIDEIARKNPQVRFDFNVVAVMPALNKINSSYFSGLPFPRARGVSYCTDAGQFYKHDIPAIIFGPGDIAQAHTNDEFIPVSELDNFVSDLMTVGKSSNI